MLASELNTIIDKQREEWKLSNGVVRAKMQDLPVQNDYATIITGLRRCGKSTLLRQWQESYPQESLMLNFDDLRMSSFTKDDFRVLDQVIDTRSPHALIFDEIQIIPYWELYVRQHLDAGHLCLITGSNASMLSRELGTKLTGRHLDLELSPFSYGEFLCYTNQTRDCASFEDYLVRGGIPSYLANGNPEILRILLDDILYRDIAVRYGIGDIHLLRSLCLYLLGTPANLVNPSKLLQIFRIRSATTILEYFSYLEQSYLVQRVTKFAHSRRAEQLAPKKLYIVDSALHGLGQINPRTDLGYLLENAIYNHLRLHSREMHYFADDATECDFVVQDARGNFSVFQVCWELTPDCQEREFRGLLHAMKHFGLKQATIITANQHDFAVQDGMDIHVVPAYEFCQ